MTTNTDIDSRLTKEIFSGKTVAVIMEEIYDAVQEDRKKTEAVYQTLVDKFNMEDSPEFHSIVGPIIAKYMDQINKGTDNLIKLTQLIEKMLSADIKRSTEIHITPEERAQQFNNSALGILDNRDKQQTS
jgi:hypothetical protein